ncbi:unnamed protein product [Acanthoscelides obtectus]|nr:unnamed protein product [Acanthoscelides obtectus]CAK1638379.1 Tetratricopeptide repeat protein 7B [Acanthoscelides obtectus]
MDAHLLLGKLQYACGQYGEGLKHFKMADLQNLSEKKLPLRSLRIVAESYAIKGLCLQKDDSATSKFKKAEKEDEMAKCFELASDLSLLYMQKVDKMQSAAASNTGSHSPQPAAPQRSLGEVLERALESASHVLQRQGRWDAAAERMRDSLRAVESSGSHAVRLKAACRLAETLLQALPGDKYKPPGTGVVGRVTASAPGSAWRPRNYAAHNQFIPRNEYEETLLVLLIAESIAVRNAVLSQSPEFKDVRISAYRDAEMVYDLLTVATVRWNQIALLQESLERSLKFSFEEIHLWKQYGLSLMGIGHFEHALAVLKEVIRLEPNDVSNCLLAAKICYEHLNLPKEGTNFSAQAREKALTSPTGLLGRCHLYIGIGYHLQTEACQLRREKDEFRCQALDNFRTAMELDPNDHLARHYLALQLALTGKITEARQQSRMSLDLRPEHSPALHLLALLLTAERRHASALAVVEDALTDYPDSLNLMYIKAYLELHEKGAEKALTAAKQMLELWKNLYEGQIVSDMPECDRKSDTRSVFQLYTSEMSDKDSSSLHFHDTAASRVERALSEVASSLSGLGPRPGPRRAWQLQLEIWLLLAEMYAAAERLQDVAACISEAEQIYPASHHVMHMKGVLHMLKQEWPDAKLCYQNAVGINPLHVKSLQELGLVYHYLGLQGLAETTLREAAKIEPKNHVTWYNLGKVLEALGEYEKASSAMATALMEEKNSPILPFNSVPLCFE